MAGYINMQTITINKDHCVFESLKEIDTASKVHFVKDVTCSWERIQGELTYAHAIISKANDKIDLKIAQTPSKDMPAEDTFSTVDLQSPIELRSVDIEKPWGKEVWFTGIEKRGISNAVLSGKEYKLSTLISLLGDKFLEKKSPEPILLKILAPNSDPNFGNLYYELHTEKQEVYIVSKISDSITQGKMKYGISQEKMSSYNSLETFKSDFKQAVKNYETVRSEVESHLKTFRDKDNINENAAISASKLQTYYKKLEINLVTQEANAKKELESFVGWKELEVGDVVSVETHVPHSLQHGVEVIEFQTPVYERFIISFDQKVLTQSNWNVDEAFEVMKMTPPSNQPLQVLESNSDYSRESVVKFSDFNVERISISGSLRVSNPQKHTLFYVLSGEVVVNVNETKNKLTPGKAYYLTSSSTGIDLENCSGDNSAQILLAKPN
jgi:mannose-6-phosphate isomerase class I